MYISQTELRLLVQNEPKKNLRLQMVLGVTHRKSVMECWWWCKGLRCLCSSLSLFFLFEYFFFYFGTTHLPAHGHLHHHRQFKIDAFLLSTRVQLVKVLFSLFLILTKSFTLLFFSRNRIYCFDSDKHHQGFKFSAETVRHLI